MKEKTGIWYLALIAVSLLWDIFFLGGCGNLVLFEPKGAVGHEVRFVICVAIGLMLIVVIPVVVMAFWFPWKYRATNTKAVYTPKWNSSAKIDWIIWLVPLAIIVVLGAMTWIETHRLDPYKPISPDIKPVRIEAVSMDWKWLFIYPDQGISVVNQLVFPAEVPLSFRITSDTVMTSFFIPQLGSQIYAMAGMETRLHLIAGEPGEYHGQNQQYSGRGFADMSFKAIALPQKHFDAWVHDVKLSSNKLDADRFEELSRPSISHAVTYFSSVTPGLFEQILQETRVIKEKAPLVATNASTSGGLNGSIR